MNKVNTVNHPSSEVQQPKDEQQLALQVNLVAKNLVRLSQNKPNYYQDQKVAFRDKPKTAS